VIDIDFLRGQQNETVVKELCVAAVSETFRFKSPYKTVDHISSENVINCADGHIENRELHAVVTKAVSGFAHL